MQMASRPLQTAVDEIAHELPLFEGPSKLGKFSIEARAYLDAGRGTIRDSFERGASGHALMRAQSTLVDRVLRSAYVFAGLDQSEGALIAIGGYGRATLAPYSDIDLLLLRADSETGRGEAYERFLYLLWDAGLELGHAVRTIEECRAIADTDATARTALLECRYICGSKARSSDLEASVLGDMVEARVEQYIADRIRDFEERGARFGQTVFRLEPDIKEGAGGLRDFQTAMWVARVRTHAAGLGALYRRGLIGESDYKSLERARDLLWRVRAALHYRAERRSDRLSFDAQEAIAPQLGFKDGTHQLGVERLMGELYLGCTEIRRRAEGLLERFEHPAEHPRELSRIKTILSGGRAIVRIGDKLAFEDARGEEVTGKGSINPAASPCVAQPGGGEESGDLEALDCLELIEFSAQQRLSIAVATRDQIRSLCLLNDSASWHSDACSQKFLRLLSEPVRFGAMLSSLHKLGVLGAIFPEYQAVSGHWQHDLYHAFTVDVHSRFAAERLAALFSPLPEGEAPSRFRLLAQELQDPAVTLLAVLLHDVGKGKGGGHSEVGAALMKKVSTRLGLEEERGATLSWLVQSHLIMNKISTRRDLSDPTLIAGFASEVESAERLRMLTLLTYVDVSTTGENTWTAWKESLLFELYDRALEMLYAQVESGATRARHERALRDEVPRRFSKEEVGEFLGLVPPRYFEAISPESAPDHLMLVHRFKREGVLQCRVGAEREDGSQCLQIATKDREGLLADLAGVIAACGHSIWSAELFSFGQGIALDVFWLQANDKQIRDWEELAKALAEGTDEPGLGSERASRRLKSLGARLERPEPDVPLRVRVDNQASSNTTVIDVFAKDRVGLLHAVTQALYREGAQVVVARVATEGNRATDAFYVVDRDGRKIRAEDDCERLKRSIEAALSEED